DRRPGTSGAGSQGGAASAGSSSQPDTGSQPAGSLDMSACSAPAGARTRDPPVPVDNPSPGDAGSGPADPVDPEQVVVEQRSDQPVNVGHAAAGDGRSEQLLAGPFPADAERVQPGEQVVAAGELLVVAWHRGHPHGRVAG